jgi:hypothetical protein
MSGVLPVLWHGPDTMEVSADVTGGQLVMADGTTGKIKPSTAAAATVLGVALDDAKLASEFPAVPANPLRVDFPRPTTSVANGVDIRVTYSGTANFGDKLVADASGKVRKYAPPSGGTDTADLIVGHCTEPGGATAGQVRRAYIAVR